MTPQHETLPETLFSVAHTDFGSDEDSRRPSAPMQHPTPLLALPVCWLLQSCSTAAAAVSMQPPSPPLRLSLSHTHTTTTTAMSIHSSLQHSVGECPCPVCVARSLPCPLCVHTPTRDSRHSCQAVPLGCLLTVMPTCLTAGQTAARRVLDLHDPDTASMPPEHILTYTLTLTHSVTLPPRHTRTDDHHAGATTPATVGCCCWCCWLLLHCGARAAGMHAG